MAIVERGVLAKKLMFIRVDWWLVEADENQRSAESSIDRNDRCLTDGPPIVYR
jgi:hypothetical protein